MPRARASAVACILVLTGVPAPSLVFAQTSPPAPTPARSPSLTRQQRAALGAVVQAVDRAAATGSGALEATWQTHVLRASDGAHYVALRATSHAAAVPEGAVVLYVRLTSHRIGAQALLARERSAVHEWLQGERSDPRPRSVGGSMSVPRGEMPVGGTAMMVGDVGAESTAALRLLMLEHQNAVKKREAEEAARRAALENPALAMASAMLPFEDFDLAARLDRAPGGGIDVRRSVAVGPGDYDLHIGWSAWAGRGAPQPVHVVTHRLRLAAATPAFGLSDVIVADRISSLAAPYPPDQQNAHPYAAGALELTPALGGVLTPEQALGLMVQVINPSAGSGGKPDVTVTFRIHRRVGERDELVGALAPLRYDAMRLPADFDVQRGHPLLAATQAPLASFARGRYRVEAVAVDHVAGRTATADATFEVVGTLASLLREAPRPGTPYARDTLLKPEVRAAIVQALAPAAPSPAMAAALDAARRGDDAVLLRFDVVPDAERAVQQALRAFGLYALGDTPRTVGAQLQAALAAGAPAPPVALLQGAALAVGGDDVGALAAWERAREAGLAPALIVPLMADGYTRRGDVARAATLARAAVEGRPDDLAAARLLASLQLAAGRTGDALALLDRAPLAAAGDADTAFLRVHARFAAFVEAARATPPATGLAAIGAAFRQDAQRYVDAAGPQVRLVEAWRQAVDARQPGER